MTLQPGSTVGPYEVVAPLGAGGMGEVYRARDTRLNRNVAIKVLPASVGDDPERLARFTREAQTLATLNHPNIAAIYGVEVYDASSRALIMELVEGEDLSTVIARGAMPVADVVAMARQIADALEAAHDQSIVHRDLKPANVKVRADGTVKVLDFGLAKVWDMSGADPANSPTLTSPATMIGTVLGTAAYMAPEQARGRAVDRRADIWSFGVVVFEMLTGRRLFDGDDVSVTIAGVLKDEPDWSRLPPSTSAALQQLLRRCLVKDPKQRLQSIGEARIQLDGLMSGSVPMNVSLDEVRGRASVLPWMVAAASAVGLVATMLMWGPWRAEQATDGGPVRVSITMPTELRVQSYQISPDGSEVMLRAIPRTEDAAGTAVSRLYVRPLGVYEATLVPGTEGAQTFTYSSDGAWLAVLAAAAGDKTDRRLLKVPVDGSSPPVVLAHWEPTWPDSLVWLEDGDLLTWVPEGSGQALLRIPGGGGAPGKAVSLQLKRGERVTRLGRSLPGDRAVFAYIDSFGPRGFQVNVWLLEPTTGAVSQLIDDAAEPVYLDSGHLVFSRGDTILASAFDIGSRTLSGEVAALEAGVSSPGGPANFGLSRTGTLAYSPTGQYENGRQIVAVATDGSVTPFVPQAGRFFRGPSLSPDGSRAVMTATTVGGTYETWIADAARGTLRRWVALPNADIAGALWSPDGLSIVYEREGLTPDDGLYLQRADFASTPRRVSGDFTNAFWTPTAWLPDSSGLIVTRSVRGGSQDLFLLPITTDGTLVPPRPLRTTSSSEESAVVSPDGRLIAFLSDESGRQEVYVAGFDNNTVGQAVMVSDGACGRVQWIAPRRLVYCAMPGTLMSADITPGLAASTPVARYDLLKLRINLNAWQVHPDGRLIGLQRSDSEDTIGAINVVLNWAETVRRRLPLGGR